MVVGLFVKSEQLWDIAKNKEEMEATVAMLGSMLDLVNQMAERIRILENHHGKLKVEII